MDTDETPVEGEPIPPSFETLCRRVFHNTDPRYFPQVQYRGRTIYFCTESCLNAFLADPERFYEAHRKTGTEKRQEAKR